jgi:hypothetical protein
MVGLHKFIAKEKRAQRRRNHIARDLLTPKYHLRVVPDKRRTDNEDGTFYLTERYYDDDE